MADEEIKTEGENVVVEEVKAESQPEEVKAEATESKSKDEVKEFVDEIMAEMELKGGQKKRLVRMLGEQCDYDKHKVLWTLKRALITERYAAAVEAKGGH